MSSMKNYFLANGSPNKFSFIHIYFEVIYGKTVAYISQNISLFYKQWIN